jgi:hypothetical protein
MVLNWLDNWASPRLAEINKKWQDKIETESKAEAEALRYDTVHYAPAAKAGGIRRCLAPVTAQTRPYCRLPLGEVVFFVGLRRRCVARKTLTTHQDTHGRESQEISCLRRGESMGPNGRSSASRAFARGEG